jgi:acyl-CoA thioesterase
MPAGARRQTRRFRAADMPIPYPCVHVTYAPDMTLLDTTVLPHGTGRRVRPDGQLDHARFHRPFRPITGSLRPAPVQLRLGLPAVDLQRGRQPVVP